MNFREKESERTEGERIFHPLVHDPKLCNKGLGQAVARSRELSLGMPAEWQRP